MHKSGMLAIYIVATHVYMQTAREANIILALLKEFLQLAPIEVSFYRTKCLLL